MRGEAEGAPVLRRRRSWKGCGRREWRDGRGKRGEMGGWEIEGEKGKRGGESLTLPVLRLELRMLFALWDPFHPGGCPSFPSSSLPPPGVLLLNGRRREGGQEQFILEASIDPLAPSFSQTHKESKGIHRWTSIPHLNLIHSVPFLPYFLAHPSTGPMARFHELLES